MPQTQLQAGSTSAGEQLAAFSNAFPKRRLSILTTGTQGLLTCIGLALGGLAFLLGILYTTLPGLLYDYKVSKDPVVDNHAQISGECKRRKAIFINCDVTIKYSATPGDTALKEIKHDFGFVSFSSSMSTEAVRSASNPDMITTTMATEHLLNRFLIVLFSTVIFGAVFLGSCYAAWVTHVFNGVIKSKPALRPILVNITQIKNQRVVNFETDIDGIKKRRTHLLRKDQAPLFLPHHDGLALGIVASGTQYAMLLTDDLTSLDLTDVEKTDLWAAIG